MTRSDLSGEAQTVQVVLAMHVERAVISHVRARVPPEPLGHGVGRIDVVVARPEPIRCVDDHVSESERMIVPAPNEREGRRVLGPRVGPGTPERPPPQAEWP